MTDFLRIVIAQIDPTVGDVDGNVERIRTAYAEGADADLVVTGELALAGYPPDDLVLKPAFQDRIEAGVAALAKITRGSGPALLIGAPWRDDGMLFNAALLLDGGEIAAVRYKWDLPNYGVFDEKRVFTPGPLPAPVPFRGVPIGVMNCEDMWTPPVSAHLAERGARLLVVLNASPFDVAKWGRRRALAAQRVAETGLPLIYVNLFGGQDELVFDGASFVLDAGGAFVVQAASWRTQVVETHWRVAGGGRWRCHLGTVEPRMEGAEAVYRAMMTGLADYVRKIGFPGVVLGLSGGIDSALSAAVAVDALGPERVRCLMLPSPYTSAESLEDAAEVARLLGVRIDTVSIAPAMQAFDAMLSELFAGRAPDVTEENIQARARAIVLMAVSNKFGDMLLTTGNKSEMSVGYATLYGDMCGGFSVLKDVYKTAVFDISRWRNRTWRADFRGPAGPVMPARVIEKPPSAELRPGQTDQDSLPPYDVLDAILQGLIEEDASIEQLIVRGHDRDTVRRVWRMLDRAEYKRRQAPPGVKITRRAFGRERRYPIINGFTNLI